MSHWTHLQPLLLLVEFFDTATAACRVGFPAQGCYGEMWVERSTVGCWRIWESPVMLRIPYRQQKWRASKQYLIAPDTILEGFTHFWRTSKGMGTCVTCSLKPFKGVWNASDARHAHTCHWLPNSSEKGKNIMLAGEEWFDLATHFLVSNYFFKKLYLLKVLPLFLSLPLYSEEHWQLVSIWQACK